MRADLRNMRHHYLPLADIAIIYDNFERGRALIAEKRPDIARRCTPAGTMAADRGRDAVTDFTAATDLPKLVLKALEEAARAVDERRVSARRTRSSPTRKQLRRRSPTRAE